VKLADEESTRFGAQCAPDTCDDDGMIRAVLAGLVVTGCSSSPAPAPDTSVEPDAAVDDRVDDPCPEISACPDPGAIVRGSGLMPLDRCAFPMAVEGFVSASLIDAFPIPRMTIAEVAADLNRTAETVTAAQVPGSAPGIRNAFRWQSGDLAVPYWIPQGITGSFDGAPSGIVNGRKLVLVSWYYDRELEPESTAEKGVRIAIVDVTDPASIQYRFALLVEPTGTPEAPTFESVPVHAGGLAWVGDRLYIPVTGSGFRVFDLSRILRVDSIEDAIGRDATGAYAAHGYQYAIPQIERIADQSACGAIFSFVAYDASSQPPSLITGEYSSTAVTGRLYRWPLAASGALQMTTRDRTIPDAVYAMAESHVQGALSNDGVWWLSSSRPAGGAGELVRVREGGTSTTFGWGDSPEDLAYDPQRDSVWSLSEVVDARYVYEVERTSIAP
jgi:hypothetical protein